MSYGKGIVNTKSLKGDYAEEISSSAFRKLGFEIFKPTGEFAHLLDGFGLGLKDGNMKFFAFDVKSKCARNKYCDTGCDIKHFKHYRKIAEKTNATFLLIFVDEGLEKVYYQVLNDYFDKEDTLKTYVNSNNQTYPMIEGSGYKEYIYFSLETMHLLKNLTPEETLKLKKFSANTKKNYMFEPIWDTSSVLNNNKNK